MFRFSTIFIFALYATTYSHAQFKIPRGDSLKGNISKIIEKRYVPGFAPVFCIYIWNAADRLLTIRYVDKDSTEIGKWVVRYDYRGCVIEECFFCENNVLCSRRSTNHNTEGREIESRFISYNANGCDAFDTRISGAWTHSITGFDSIVAVDKYQYDKMGRVTTVTSSYIITRLMNSDTTITTTTYRYNSGGKIVWLKKERIMITNESIDTTVEISNYKYNTLGRKTEWLKQNIIIRYGDADTSIDLTSYKYNGNSEKPEEIKRISYVLWPPHTDTSMTILTYDNDGDNNDAENISLIDWPGNEKEYDKQGNIIKLISNGDTVFTREIQYLD